MKVKEFIRKYLLTWVNQRLPSALVWVEGLLSAVNLALNDIYTFEWRYWPFMFRTDRINWAGDSYDPNDTRRGFMTLETSDPIIKISYIKDLDKPEEEYYWKYQKQGSDTQPEWLQRDEVGYYQYGNEISLPVNKKGYVVSYIAAHKELTSLEDEIQIPFPFYSALYLFALSYLYPQQGQYGENKEVNAYQRARQIMMDLAKSSMPGFGFINLK